MTSWEDYMLMAARHSRGSASHWLRYLGKVIDNYEISFSKEDVDRLYNNEALTPFQRVSLKFAFQKGSPTMQHIQSMNKKATASRVVEMRKRYERNN